MVTRTEGSNGEFVKEGSKLQGQRVEGTGWSESAFQRRAGARGCFHNFIIPDRCC